MRGKRAKQYRKLMHQYGLAFGFREPYQVLLDAAVIKDAAAFRMRLGAMLSTTLHGPIKPMITQCCIRHLYDDASDAPEAAKRGWIEVAKQAERRRCGHHELATPLSAHACIASVVDPKRSGANRHRYVVATQDAELRRALREEVAGVPLVYISRSVMILEPMARRTEEVKEKDEMGKIRAGLKGRRGGGGVEEAAVAQTDGKKRKREGEEQTEEGAQEEREPKKSKKVRGPKGPNPLSMKKSKKENTTAAKKVEDERAAIRAAAKRDPQAAEKAVDADVAAFEASDGVLDGQRKRKRKRKPKETAAADSENQSDDGDD